MDNTPPARLIVYGASGRLGSRICTAAFGDARFHLVAAVAHDGSLSVGANVPNNAATASEEPRIHLEIQANSRDDCDVIVDASTPEGTRRALAHALDIRAALLVCTTGLDEAMLGEISRAAAVVPILIAPNTSAGVAALRKAVSSLSESLKDISSASIIETHRAEKRDAPSGTARALATDIRRAGARIDNTNIASLRIGACFGEHTVRFELDGECIEITHRAHTVDVFAFGALRAAAWLAAQRPGNYEMSHVAG